MPISAPESTKEHQEGTHLVDHGTEPAADAAEFSERLFEHGGEGKEAEGVACRCGVKDDDGKLHRSDVSAKRKMQLDLKRGEQQAAHFMTSAKLMASSTPGMEKAISCIMDPIMPFWSATEEVSDEEWKSDDEGCLLHCSTISWITLVGSISIAYRLSNPFTLVASLENFWPKASERLCAGSVDCGCAVNRQSLFARSGQEGRRTMSRTDSRHWASWMASEQDVVVLPV